MTSSVTLSGAFANAADRNEIELSAVPVDLIPVTALEQDAAIFPRSAGVDSEHLKILYEVGSEAPPIVVHRQTMRVIDGVHRWCAARLRGDKYIRARLVDGRDDEVFLLAVKLNVEYGLPLSRGDRIAAAQRIMRSYPTWSDRRIARASGLSGKTVASLRNSAPGALSASRRVGCDERVRPQEISEGRSRAAALLRENPGLSLREISRAAGISVGTARDVKLRVLRGADPLPPKQRRSKDPGTSSPPPAEPRPARLKAQERQRTIARLARDPSLRQTETGRAVLRMLAAHCVGADEWERLARSVPPHGVDAVLALARACAEDWSSFVRYLESGRPAGAT